MIHFLQITIQSKASDDWRAFLDWTDDEEKIVYQLRGYGDTPGSAADDAYRKFNDEDRDMYTEDSWDWK